MNNEKLSTKVVQTYVYKQRPNVTKNELDPGKGSDQQ